MLGATISESRVSLLLAATSALRPTTFSVAFPTRRGFPIKKLEIYFQHDGSAFTGRQKDT